LADTEGNGRISRDFDADGKAVRKADPVDGLTHFGEEFHGGTVGVKNSPSHTLDETFEGFIIATDESDGCLAAFLEVVELGFHEVGGYPE
jgi:hypothetical protein